MNDKLPLSPPEENPSAAIDTWFARSGPTMARRRRATRSARVRANAQPRTAAPALGAKSTLPSKPFLDDSLHGLEGHDYLAHFLEQFASRYRA